MARDQRLNVEITATDRASDKVDDVARKVDRLDGETADIKIDADTQGLSAGLAEVGDQLSGFGGPVGDFGSKLGALASPQGAIAGIAGGLLLAADHAADVAIEADNLAALTGDSVEEASRLNAVWKHTGADTKDLQDVLLQMNGVLSTNADIAKTLGINLSDGATVGERFKQVSEALDKIPDAAKRSQIASQVFGEEGVRQYNALRQSVDSLDEAMSNVDAGEVITEEEARRAREFKKQITELKAELANAAAVIGTTVIPIVLKLSDGFSKATDAAKDLHLDDIAKWASFVGPLQKIGGWLGIGGGESIGDGMRDFVDEAASAEPVIDAVNAAVEEATLIAQKHEHQMKNSGHQAEDYEAALTGMGEAHQALTAATEAQEEADRAARDSWEHSYDAIVANKEATDRLREARRQLTDQSYALHDAEYALEQAVDSATETLANEDTTLRGARAAMENVAVAADEAARKQLELSGQTLATDDGMNSWIDTMLETASTLEGPLRDQVLRHISTIAGIPLDVVTKFGVDVDAERLRQLENDLNFTARERFVRFSPLGNGVQNRYATGTTNAKPGLALVGEQGPELVNFGGGEQVLNASRTAALASSPAGAMGGDVYFQITMTGVNDPNKFAEELNRFVRQNGPGPLRRMLGLPAVG